MNYFIGQKKSNEIKNKKIGGKKLDQILVTCLNFGHFCSKQVLTSCQNLKSCILCNCSKNLGFVGLIRSNIPHRGLLKTGPYILHSTGQF